MNLAVAVASLRVERHESLSVKLLGGAYMSMQVWSYSNWTRGQHVYEYVCEEENHILCDVLMSTILLIHLSFRIEWMETETVSLDIES